MTSHPLYFSLQTKWHQINYILVQNQTSHRLYFGLQIQHHIHSSGLKTKRYHIYSILVCKPNDITSTVFLSYRTNTTSTLFWSRNQNVSHPLYLACKPSDITSTLFGLQTKRHHIHSIWPANQATSPDSKRENETASPDTYGEPTLRASLSGTFLQTLPDLVTPLKGYSLSPRSCPATRSAPSEKFGY